MVATDALELGVNIGGLDAAVLTGFPGTIASAWQQAGRAGRRSAVSLAVLVATACALDQLSSVTLSISLAAARNMSDHYG